MQELEVGPQSSQPETSSLPNFGTLGDSESLRTYFAQATVGDISQAIDQVIGQTAEENPDLSGLPLYERLAETFPRIGRQKQREVLQAISWGDADAAAKAKKILLFTGLKTIFSASKPFLTSDEKENEEIVHAAILGVWDYVPSSKSSGQPMTFLYNCAQSGVLNFLADKYGVPPAWIMAVHTKQLVDLIKLFRNPKGLAPNDVSLLSQILIDEFNINKEQVEGFVKVYNEQVIAAKNPPDYFERETEFALREAENDVLARINPRKKRALELRFGLNGNVVHTYAEMGDVFHIWGTSVKQIVDSAARDIRRDGRQMLRYFYDHSGDMLMPIRYNPGDFVDSRTIPLDERIQFQVRQEPPRPVLQKPAIQQEQSQSLLPYTHPDWLRKTQSIRESGESTFPKRLPILDLVLEKSREGAFLNVEKLRALYNALESQFSIEGITYSRNAAMKRLPELAVFIEEIERGGEDSILHLGIERKFIERLLNFKKRAAYFQLGSDSEMLLRMSTDLNVGRISGLKKFIGLLKSDLELEYEFRLDYSLPEEERESFLQAIADFERARDSLDKS